MDKNTDTLNVYKGKGLLCKKKKNNSVKTFVFDLDETIGSFTDLYILFKSIEEIQSKTDDPLYKSDEYLLFNLLDIFPEFFRYGISVLFKYLNDKKNTHDINVYIYTNNTCIPITWTSIIINYIEKKWDISLFDNIIRCFKIKDRIIEYKRTTTEKTFHDLIRCIKLSTNTELCFIDNVLFPKMLHRYVYYLRPKPYYHYINREDILNRFILSDIGKEIYTKLQVDSEYLFDTLKTWYHNQGYFFDSYGRTQQELDVDIEVSKKLFYHCRLFFHMTTKKNKTKKKNLSLKANITKKLR